MSGDWKRNQANDGKDLFRRTLAPGDKVFRAAMSGRAPYIEVRTVSRIDGKDVYLAPDGYSSREGKLNYSGRVVKIVNEELYEVSK
ncbi:hypothetical protein [Caulobacter phage Cr30]|uniref:hypothetical protein n=1 Tax=Caulobacter phage Cr30 TaxID=1357714 RepID=UPI0004A9B5B4|nr:hypothetical protein OZ74_gp113 [Caulobacter phage Cr30]AGS80998.1 hypothetical protein [Caulobacter phage Cr30]